MAVYYVNLLLILVLAYPLCLYKPSKIKKIIYIVATLGYMWFLATFRYGIGFDFYTYIEIFQTIRDTDGLKNLLALFWEPGFVLTTKAMSFFIHDQTVMYGVYQLLIMAPIGWFVYKYCEDAWLSIWLYATLTFYYTSMNFTRQSIACSIIVLGYGFLRKKKYILFLLIVLLAASFHRTALVMIPVCLVCHIRMNKKWAIVYGGGTLLTYLFAPYIWDLATNYFYAAYKDSLWSSSFPAIFIIVPIAVFGTCLALWPTWRKRWEDADMLLNLMMYSAIIWLFITQIMILERLSMFMYIFVMIALPQAVSALKRPLEEYDQLAEMRLAAEKTSKKGAKATKSETAAVKALAQKISDHKKYYWSAVVAVLLLTGIYHEFGANVNGFHAVFPYQSQIAALDAPGVNEGVYIPENWQDMRAE